MKGRKARRSFSLLLPSALLQKRMQPSGDFLDFFSFAAQRILSCRKGRNSLHTQINKGRWWLDTSFTTEGTLWKAKRRKIDRQEAHGEYPGRLFIIPTLHFRWAAVEQYMSQCRRRPSLYQNSRNWSHSGKKKQQRRPRLLKSSQAWRQNTTRNECWPENSAGCVDFLPR